MASVTEELNVKFYLMNLNLNTHKWLKDTLLDSVSKIKSVQISLYTLILLFQKKVKLESKKLNSSPTLTTLDSLLNEPL